MASSAKLQRIVDAMIELDEMWIRGSIGVLMADAFYADQTITADYLAVRMRFSDDSARRWLQELAERGTITVSQAGKLRTYRATREAAEQTMKIIDRVPHI